MAMSPVVESGGAADFAYAKAYFPGPLRLDTAWRNRNSICAFTLRRSSAAHFSSSLSRSGGILSKKGLRCSDGTGQV
jgi:hypothetical protein